MKEKEESDNIGKCCLFYDKVRLCSHLASFFKLPAHVLHYNHINRVSQKIPEHFLKRHRLFLHLRASFQVKKSLTFLKKEYALRQVPF